MDVVIPGPFGALLSSPEQLTAVAAQVERVILESFGWEAAHKLVVPVVTQPEIKRRFDIVEKYFRIFRGDLKWSVERALDHIGPALFCELVNGTPYEIPAERDTWIQTTDEKAVVE